MESLRHRYSSHMLATLLFMWHQVRIVNAEANATAVTDAEFNAAVHCCGTALPILPIFESMCTAYSSRWCSSLISTTRNVHQQHTSVLISNRASCRGLACHVTMGLLAAA
jgi:hypothetical protein